MDQSPVGDPSPLFFSVCLYTPAPIWLCCGLPSSVSQFSSGSCLPTASVYLDTWTETHLCSSLQISRGGIRLTTLRLTCLIPRLISFSQRDGVFSGGTQLFPKECCGTMKRSSRCSEKREGWANKHLKGGHNSKENIFLK